MVRKYDIIVIRNGIRFHRATLYARNPLHAKEKYWKREYLLKRNKKIAMKRIPRRLINRTEAVLLNNKKGAKYGKKKTS